MADNQAMNGTTALVASKEATHSGDLAQVQLMEMVTTTGVEGSRAVAGSPFPALSFGTPAYNEAAIPVRNIGVSYYDCSFHASGSGLLATEMTQLALTGSHTISQANGNLVIASGVTTNSEFLARSVDTFDGAFQFSLSLTASQRIANNNFAVIIGDLIGAGLAYTINSATSITVTKTAHGFTAANVGQFMFVGGLSVAGSVPGRYAIASIPNADSINFTVAGFPASGSGTCTLFGHSHYKLLHTGTVATNVNAAVQRKGWAASDVVATINTTASPGTIEYINAEVSMTFLADRLRASQASLAATSRASWSDNIPPAETPLHVFLWAYNGTTAPASTTTWTIGLWRIEDSSKTPVSIAGINQIGTQNILPVVLTTNPTIAGLPALPAGTNLIGDVGFQYRANATGAATTFKFASAATVNNALILTGARRLLGWSLTNTTAAFKYFRFYNKATIPASGESPTFMVGIPPNSTVVSPPVVGGIAMSLGLGIACTNGVTDTDSTVTAVNDVIGSIYYA